MVNPILAILRLILNPCTLKGLIAAFFAIIIGLVIYNSVVPAEHCVENTQEVKSVLSANGIAISHSDKGQNKICLRSNDANLIKEIANKSQQAYLQLELEKIRGKQAWWDKHGITVILIGVAMIIIIAIAFISSRRENHSL